ncbi:hypothetical protein Cs7R123_42780 [Catellatospora sp. TT07R-123]|uniref:WXG100 family type VII secretion target n=1 Tax=Catellatospora sp. TT07R-123 TaxID=2733863 RepID=UPI001B0CA216|nr:WXG100 family type VII secretion target [Catellatospora sp. TT07R-123]GHJ46936.1 hypothetical protein Cs7R123_42780 [Catellatospora sp. TT07R-123]
MAFGITYEVVNGAADQLRAQNRALSEVVEHMRATASARFAQWNALSVTTYTDAQTKWNNSAGVMSGDLEANVQRLMTIVANYQDADRRASGGL